MTIDELRAKLDEKGVKYDKRWGIRKLEEALAAVPTYSEVQIKAIVDEVSGKNEKPIEVILENVTRDVDGIRTEAGIMIPEEVLAARRPTPWTYRLDRKSDSCAVYKFAENGYSVFVREYTRSVHGDGFAELAERFLSQYPH